MVKATTITKATIATVTSKETKQANPTLATTKIKQQLLHQWQKQQHQQNQP